MKYFAKYSLALVITCTQSGCMTAILIDSSLSPEPRHHHWARSTSAYIEDDTLVVNGIGVSRYDDRKGRKMSARYSLDEETRLPNPKPQDVILSSRRKSREATSIPIKRTRTSYNETMRAHRNGDRETILKGLACSRVCQLFCIPHGPIIVVNTIDHDLSKYNRYQSYGQSLLYAENVHDEAAVIISLGHPFHASNRYENVAGLLFVPVTLAADVLTAPLQLIFLGIVWSVDWTAPY